MKKLLILIILLTAVSVQAQLVDDASIENVKSSTSHNLKPAVTPFSLLDLSRVKWSNSYSVAYFSGGGSSSSLGIWNTSLFYEFSSKLTLALNVGVVHNPGAIWGDSNNSTDYLPGFQLDYRPSKNFSISIGMQSYTGNSNYVNPYYSSGYLHNSFLR